MKKRGRPILGAISGFFFGDFVNILLLTFGVVALDSIILVILPFAFLVLGAVWGKLAPLGKAPAASTPAAMPPPMAPPAAPQPQ